MLTSASSRKKRLWSIVASSVLLLASSVLLPLSALAFTVIGNVCYSTQVAAPGITLAADGTVYAASSLGLSDECSSSNGSIFRLTPSGSPRSATYTFTDLFDFSGPDGAFPNGGVAFGPSGYPANLFGSCGAGGGGTGTVYRLTNGALTTLHSFGGNGENGTSPIGRPVVSKDGRLYGVTGGQNGSGNAGSVFVLRQDGTLKFLKSFTGYAGDGVSPWAGLLAQDIDTANAALYGTTEYGGTCQTGNCGTVFQLKSDGQNWAFRYLYDFSGPDGSFPASKLGLDAQGNLYGTTKIGGLCNSGTIFKLAPDGQLTTLHNFGCTNIDGQNPEGDLAQDSGGNWYGTATGGGKFGEGIVYKLAPNGTLSTLHDFTGGADGANPSGVALNVPGTVLYGMTYTGTIYRLRTSE